MGRNTLRNKSFRRKSLKRSKTLKRNKSFRRKSLRNKSFRRKSLKKMRGGGPKTSRTCEMWNFGKRAREHGSTYSEGEIVDISKGNVTLVVTLDGTSHYNIVINLYSDNTRNKIDRTLNGSYSVSQFKRLVDNLKSNIKEKPGATIESRYKLSSLTSDLKGMTKTYRGTMGVGNCAERVRNIAYVCQWLENLYTNHNNYLFKDGTQITKIDLKLLYIQLLDTTLSGISEAP